MSVDEAMPSVFRFEIRHFAPSALRDMYCSLPRALPWALTFRAFGAEDRTFHTISVLGRSTRQGQQTTNEKFRVEKEKTTTRSWSQERRPAHVRKACSGSGRRGVGYTPSEHRICSRAGPVSESDSHAFAVANARAVASNEGHAASGRETYRH